MVLEHCGPVLVKSEGVKLIAPKNQGFPFLRARRFFGVRQVF